jgi:hypothetical protein
MKSAAKMVKRLAGCLAYGTSLFLVASFGSSQTVTSAGSAKRVRPLNADCVQVDQDLPQRDKIVRPWQMEQLIRVLEGDWDTEDTYEPNGPAASRTTAHSLETFRPGPARLSLIEEFRSKDPGDPSRGLGVFWWEQASHGIHVLWCDNDTPGTGCRLLAGVSIWQGSDFVLTDIRRE